MKENVSNVCHNNKKKKKKRFGEQRKEKLIRVNEGFNWKEAFHFASFLQLNLGEGDSCLSVHQGSH